MKKKVEKSWKKVGKKLEKSLKKLKKVEKNVEKKVEKSWEKVGKKLEKSWKKSEKSQKKFKFSTFFLNSSPRSNVGRVSSLKSHYLCPNSKVAETTKGRYRAAKAAKNEKQS